MNINDAVQLGKDRYFGSRLGEHDERLGDLANRLDALPGAEQVDVPPELAAFIGEVREQGANDELAVAAVFERFGLGVFTDRQIAAALQPAPQPEGDEPQAEDPGDEPGSDEDPGE